MSNWFSAHTHTQFSPLDGMSKVPDVVARAAKYGQPAVGFTEHGNMAGAIQAYTAGKKHDVMTYLGVEAYLLDPYTVLEDVQKRGAPKPKRYHLGLLATSYDGYRALSGLVSASHTRPRFSRYPRITLDDLAQLSEDAADDIVLTTGCYFGLIQQALVNDGELKAEALVRMYAKWFPHTYVEVQHHSICHDEEGIVNLMDDDDIVVAMMGIADKIGLPVIATQDSHYLDQKEKSAHALMKRMVYGGVEDEFPGDAFHVASTGWVSEHYTDEQWSRIEEGHADMLDRYALSIPALDNYKVHVPQLTDDPLRAMWRLCNKALDDYAPRMRKRYDKRLRYEMDVVEELGMAGYFMLWVTVLRYMSSKGICYEARGSANASLFCFLLGITQVDPLKWDLTEHSFDRFLSVDRIKPPDVDMDVEDVARQRIIAYLSRSFDVLPIGTWSKLGVNDEGKGSVLVSYKAGMARDMDKEEKQRFYARIQTIDDVKRYYPQDYNALARMAGMDVFKSYGVHASGILISGSDQRIADYVPHMLVASSNTTVSQFDQDDVEQLGFLKLDLLGQNTLTIMRRCQEMIGRTDPTDFTWIPLDDSKACAILREGRTDNGIFHFEGYTKAKGGKEMGIRTTKDAVLASALFMPGAMDTGQKDMYLHRRRDVSARDRVKYLHPVYEEALKVTHGAVVFQDQVVQIMRGLGMSIAGVNSFFKIVKDSGSGAVVRNSERLAALHDEFEDLCDAAGIDDVEAAWGQTAGFVAYGFNRAHATGYGLRSYRCAYLKAHYPLEFMTALLQSWTGTDKETLYIRECRRLGIRILPADVNVSGTTWTIDRRRKAILRPLSSIKGVGYGAAESIEANAPYTDLQDLIDRTDSRLVTGGKAYGKDGSLNGVLAHLRNAGALKSLGIERDDA